MNDFEVVLEVDSDAGAAYLQLSDNEVAKTVEVVPEVQVDLDDLNLAVGVEILDLGIAVPVEKISQECHIHTDQLQVLHSLRGSVDALVMHVSSQGSSTQMATTDFEFC